MLLTVGSALVAFRGVPGQATNGDLSSIELRQQSERAAQGDGGLLAAGDVLADSESGTRDGASGDVFGARAAGTTAAGRFLGSRGRGQRDVLVPGSPSAPLGQRAPTGQTTAPGSGPVATPPLTTDEGSGSGSEPSGGSGTGSGTGSDPGSGSGSDPGTGTATDPDPGSGTGSDPGSGSGSGSGSGTGGGSNSGGGSTSSDSGSGSGGSGGSGSGSGTGSGTVTDTVGGVTDTVGSVVGVASPPAGETASNTGTTAGGLLNDATSVVTGLTG